MTDRLSPTPEGIATAAGILRDGGLVAFPTDTVYGLACAGSRPDRVEALFALKRRPAEKQIPMLVAGIDALPDGWVSGERARSLAERFWPGALTLVLPTAGDAGAGATQAFRAPDHAVAKSLIAASGPLLATSANISGEPDTLDADDVLIAFATQADELAAVIDGGRVPGGVASTVVSLVTEPARLLREGPVTRDAIANVVAID